MLSYIANCFLVIVFSCSWYGISLEPTVISSSGQHDYIGRYAYTGKVVLQNVRVIEVSSL